MTRNAQASLPAAGGRDYVMARLAAATASLQAAKDAVDEAMALFVAPEDDRGGRKRSEAVAAALDHTGCAARALECAEEEVTTAGVNWAEREPWDEDEDEEDG